MRVVTKMETFDGKLHANQSDACRHLDRIYGDKLTSISHAIVSLDWKYTSVTDYIDAHLAEFVELHAIGKDRAMIQEDD